MLHPSGSAALSVHGAYACRRGERPSEFRAPLSKSLEALSSNSSSLVSCRAARSLPLADPFATKAAPFTPRAAPIVLRASLFRNSGLADRFSRRPLKVPRAALDSAARADRMARGAMHSSRGANPFSRLAEESWRRSHFGPRVAAASRLPFEKTGTLAARSARLCHSIERRLLH